MLVSKKEITVKENEKHVLSFEDYCTVGSIAVKYSMFKVLISEPEWDKQRRKFIKRKEGQDWIDTEITNEYAQFIIGTQLAETNYFESATELCFKALGISS